MGIRIETFSLGPLSTNAYLILDDSGSRGIVVDPGMNPDRLLQRIQDVEIEAILLTHAHFDHIGGVDRLRKLKGCPVYLHDAEADWLEKPEKNGSMMWPDVSKPIRSDAPEFVLRDGQELHLLGRAFHVFHTPGHSPGSVSFLTDDHLFSGDVLFCMGVGRTDLPGGSSRELYASIEFLFTLADGTKVYPGHGPETTIGFEKANNPYV